MTRGTFLRVECSECGNEQIIFSKPAGDVECIVCDELLAEATGGQARILAADAAEV